MRIRCDPLTLLKIAIQGEPGSFSHEAAIEAGGRDQSSRFGLFRFRFRLKCLQGRWCRADVDAAVIPIENSLAGSVSEHFDLMLTHDVSIVRETLAADPS